MLCTVSVPIAEAGMRTEDIARAVMNVISHGPSGPTGEPSMFGTSGTARSESLRKIAALAPS